MQRLSLTLLVACAVGCSQQASVEPTSKPVESAAAEPPGVKTPAPAVSPSPATPAAQSAPAAGDSNAPGGADIDLELVRLTAPKGWLRKEPAMPGFVLAELALPHAEGDPADGRLTVSVAGGSVESNVARWRQQFGDKPDKEATEKLDVGGLAVTLVDLSGTYRDQRGMMGPAIERANYRMLGAIFQAGDKTHFIKAYGPAKTMGQQVEAFKQFVRSAKTK